MRIRALILVAIVSCAPAACRSRRTTEDPVPARTALDSEAHASPAPASAACVPMSGSPAQAPPAETAPLMSDTELGRLVDSLSEAPGEFPSDNFVSNETSMLHVAPLLRADSLRGRAYVGVGPEQNLTYIGLMRPSVAYVVDIRRQNMLEHLALRAAMERAHDRLELVTLLSSRAIDRGAVADPRRASVEELADAAARAAPSRPMLDEAVERTVALQARLGIAAAPGDRAALRAALRAFQEKALDLAFTMRASGRRYPPLRALLGAKDPDGVASSFLGTEDAYAAVRAIVVSNRVVPVVGDFAGSKAFRGIGHDMRERRQSLGALYTSNVEQYLFAPNVYGRFVDNARALPHDDHSLIVRVWFDQGRAHPRQQPGHRTATLATSLARFLARHDARPYRSYWEVATDEPATAR
jgi:hypothetical protein